MRDDIANQKYSAIIENIKCMRGDDQIQLSKAFIFKLDSTLLNFNYHKQMSHFDIKKSS